MAGIINFKIRCYKINNGPILLVDTLFDINWVDGCGADAGTFTSKAPSLPTAEYDTQP